MRLIALARCYREFDITPKQNNAQAKRMQARLFFPLLELIDFMLTNSMLISSWIRSTVQEFFDQCFALPKEHFGKYQANNLRRDH